MLEGSVFKLCQQQIVKHLARVAVRLLLAHIGLNDYAYGVVSQSRPYALPSLALFFLTSFCQPLYFVQVMVHS
jgi:hypothetical protein